MKFQAIGIPPEQAQFLETRKFQINEIARIFRVPPHMLADLEKSSFSNIEQQSLEFVKYTLDPWVIRWEQSIQRALLSREEKRESRTTQSLECELPVGLATFGTGSRMKKAERFTLTEPLLRKLGMATKSHLSSLNQNL